ncbi:MAG: hypothetical protein ABIO70_04510, partial [Pseudomonadota bacterium]
MPQKAQRRLVKKVEKKAKLPLDERRRLARELLKESDYPSDGNGSDLVDADEEDDVEEVEEQESPRRVSSSSSARDNAGLIREAARL